MALSEKERVCLALYQADCLKFIVVDFKNNLRSPFYFDNRQLWSHPEQKDVVIDSHERIIRELTRVISDNSQSFVLAGVPEGATPSVSSLTDRLRIPQIGPRLQLKEHGLKKAIEGFYNFGDTAIVIEDVITTGGSVLETVGVLRAGGLIVNDVVVLLDYGFGAVQNLQRQNLKVHPILQAKQAIQYYRHHQLYSKENLELAMEFLTAHAVN